MRENNITENRITENEIRATLSFGKNIAKAKFVVAMVALVVSLLCLYASGILIIVNADTVGEMVGFAILLIAFSCIFIPVMCSIVIRRSKIRLWLKDAVLLDAGCKRTYDDPNVVNRRGISRLFVVSDQNYSDVVKDTYGIKIAVSFEYNGQQISRISGHKKNKKLFNLLDGYDTAYKKFAGRDIKILYSLRYDEVMIPEQ